MCSRSQVASLAGPRTTTFHWTDEAAVRTHILVELSGTVREGGLATENRFSFAGNEDNRFTYLVTLLTIYLARREVNPSGKVRHF